MEIFIYKGIISLPSIDLECLRTIAFIKIIDAPVTINTNGNPFKSPNGQLPYLQISADNNRKVAGYEHIVEYLKEKGYVAKDKMSPIDLGLSSSYIHFLKENIYPSMQYYLWGDQVNGEHTRMLYAKRTPFPFNFYYPQQYIKRTDKLMQILENFSINDKLENHQNLLIKAKYSLNLLADKLDKRLTLIQNSYTEIDATLYAYLAIIYYIPLQNNPLQAHLRECPFLVKFVEMFYKKFMAGIKDTLISNENNSSDNTGTSSTIDNEEKMFSKKMPIILSVVGATCAMSLFAIRQGILDFSTDRMLDYGMAYDDDDDDDEIDDDG